MTYPAPLPGGAPRPITSRSRTWRPRATLVAVIGLTIAVVLACWPIHESSFGTDYSCGPSWSAVVADSANSSNRLANSVAAQCRRDGSQQLVIAGAILIAAVIAAAVITTTMPDAVREPAPAPGWYPDPWRRSRFRFFDGHDWTPHESYDGQPT